jgi:hypothetical protein
VVGQLEAEAQAIQVERQRLEDAFRRDGYTGEHIVAHNNLAVRESRFLAQVNLQATQMAEAERAVDKEGQEEAWKAYVAANPGVQPKVLRKAFLFDQQEAAKVKKPAATGDPDRKVVNLSGPGEVSASERRARTVSIEQLRQQKAALREKGDDAAAAALDRKVRSGEIILKG